jgi:hypothetical protein
MKSGIRKLSHPCDHDDRDQKCHADGERPDPPLDLGFFGWSEVKGFVEIE